MRSLSTLSTTTLTLVALAGSGALSYALVALAGGSAIEVSGTCLSYVGAFLLSQGRRSNYLYTAVGALLFIYLFSSAQLYGSVILNAVFAIGSLYAFAKWSDNSAPQEIDPIKMLALFPGTYVLCVGVLIVAHSHSVWVNAFMLACGIFAQIHVARKSWVAWHYFNALALTSAIFFAHSGSWVLSAQFVIFFINGCFGLKNWLTSARAEDHLIKA